MRARRGGVRGRTRGTFGRVYLHRESHSVALALLVFVVLMTVSVSGLAEERSCPRPEPVPLSVLLLAPPCDSCDETQAELAELLALQKSRTPEEAEHAKGDHNRSVGRFLGEVGITIKEDQLNFANHFFQCIDRIVHDAVGNAKTKFSRTRPYKLTDNGLHFLKNLKADDGSAYPSGHAAYGTVIGLVLADMVPELREKIYDRIQDYGFSRMKAGVHFRSDVYAGEIAGAAIAVSLYQNDEFRHAFERAKIDLRKALGYQAQ
jgi:acid phosphatase (class A)